MENQTAYIQFITQLVTWALVIAGWWYVNSQTNLRENRKEIRDFIADIFKSVTEIRDAAIKYHTAEAQDKAVASDLRFKLKMLGIRYTALKKYGVVHDVDGVKDLRRSITLHNFDDGGFAQQEHASLFIISIEAAATELTDGLEQHFLNAFLGKKCRSFKMCQQRLRIQSAKNRDEATS